jgi:hypothetical protein
MDNFAVLMQRLLEVQSGGRERSPKLISEDERLMDQLEKRALAGKPPQTVRLGQDRLVAGAIQGLTFPEIFYVSASSDCYKGSVDGVCAQSQI